MFCKIQKSQNNLTQTKSLDIFWPRSPLPASSTREARDPHACSARPLPTCAAARYPLQQRTVPCPLWDTHSMLLPTGSCCPPRHPRSPNHDTRPTKPPPGRPQPALPPPHQAVAPITPALGPCCSRTLVLSLLPWALVCALLLPLRSCLLLLPYPGLVCAHGTRTRTRQGTCALGKTPPLPRYPSLSLALTQKHTHIKTRARPRARAADWVAVVHTQDTARPTRQTQQGGPGRSGTRRRISSSDSGTPCTCAT
jgi:hypothetical protein